MNKLLLACNRIFAIANKKFQSFRIHGKVELKYNNSCYELWKIHFNPIDSRRRKDREEQRNLEGENRKGKERKKGRRAVRERRRIFEREEITES